MKLRTLIVAAAGAAVLLSGPASAAVPFAASAPEAGSAAELAAAKSSSSGNARGAAQKAFKQLRIQSGKELRSRRDVLRGGYARHLQQRAGSPGGGSTGSAGSSTGGTGSSAGSTGGSLASSGGASR